VHAHNLENQAIEIVAQAMATDDPSAFNSRSAIQVVGYDMTKHCADKVFSDAGFKPGEGRDQVGVIELHDCFAANEVRPPLSSLRDAPFSHIAHS
jgi:sterol carrier protein 2